MLTFISRIKPGESEAVMSEIGALGGGRRIQALVVGQPMKPG